MAQHYPINLALEDKKCVVVGAGQVAQRKIRRLLECGARVLVISPKITPALKALADKKKIVFKNRRVDEQYVPRAEARGSIAVLARGHATPACRNAALRRAGTGKWRPEGSSLDVKDLKGAYLVIAATTDRRINATLSSYCRKKNILINVVDSPKECNFILPSVVRRGDLTISISTEGVSPALARKIRRDLEQRFGAEYARLLRILKEMRPRVVKKIRDIRSRRAFFQKVFQSGVIDLLKRNKEKQAKRKLERILKDARI